MVKPCGVVISAAPRPDSACSVVEVRPGPGSHATITFSNGEEVYSRFQKLTTLCEQLAQEQSAVTYRVWWTLEGTELIEVHRTSTPLKTEMPFISEVF